MTKRKASAKAAKPAAKAKPTPPTATRRKAAQAAPVAAIAKKGVIRKGCTVTRHYGDGTSSTQNFSNEASAKAYATSCGGGE